MSQFAEYVSFHTEGIEETQFLERRREAILAVKAAHPALVAVPLISQDERGVWTDVWIYESEEAAQKANADAENIPAFVEMAKVLSNLTIVSGRLPVGGGSPL